ncbi:MAG: glycosyltransferase family 4 protein [Dehalococcoidia bacterium]|nr:glycosyltransferase family 4 protein [Dehalococcoidia bacterium]
MREVCIISPVPVDLQHGGGGIRRFVRELVPYLSERGVSSTIIPLIKQPINSRVASPMLHVYFIVRAVATFRRLHRKRSFRLIHAQDSFYCGIVGVLASKMFRVPLLIHYHDSPFFRHSSMVSATKDPYYRISRRVIFPIEAGVLKSADYVIATNGFLGDFLRKQNIPEEKMSVIPMGVQMPAFQPTTGEERNRLRQSLGLQPGTRTIAYIGRLSSVKGLTALVEAFADVRQAGLDACLLIIGDGPQRGELESKADQMGVRDSVIFTGFRRDVAQLLWATDVFAYPSYAEGSPLSVLEAMATGRAILGSTIPSISEQVQHRHSALLVEPGNREAIGEALKELLADENLRKTLGDNARQRALEFYDAEKNFFKIGQIYERLMGPDEAAGPVRPAG